ncbi:hypothetical protein CHARACLAT_016041 [Characodon lateralis]|uniref:Uncharacterized protein n=1 Tax=Characodon lateralis TaxID=208331 RepID=A0ABU7CQR5_9TELE|nr:hypothetical protein [Characodon lateralis]
MYGRNVWKRETGIRDMILQPCLSETHNTAFPILLGPLYGLEFIYFVSHHSHIAHHNRCKTWFELPPSLFSVLLLCIHGASFSTHQGLGVVVEVLFELLIYTAQKKK